jgi:hypothetical protein
MRNHLFTLALLSSALILPLTAHADTIDDFRITGGGHIITYSLPATSSYPNFSLFNFFSESAPTTIDGTSGYVEQGLYYLDFFPELTLALSVPDAVFGVSQLDLSGQNFVSYVIVPATNPPPYLQSDVVATFIPGTYSLLTTPSFSDPLAPPVPYSITITEETASTPEPSTLVFLTTGLIGGLGALRRRFNHR